MIHLLHFVDQKIHVKKKVTAFVESFFIKDVAKFSKKIYLKHLRTYFQRKREDWGLFYRVYQLMFALRISVFNGGNKHDMIDLCELHTSFKCRKSEIWRLRAPDAIRAIMVAVIR